MDNNMKGKRTGIDFSKHELHKSSYAGGESVVYDLKIPNTIFNRIKYINTEDIMAVTGDYGNWIFCRGFHPSKDGNACDNYWAEKLRIASTQDPMKFSGTEACGAIDALLADPQNEFSEEEKEWLGELQDAAKGGEEYAYIAKGMECPGSFPTEMIPSGKVYDVWFLTILDGFDEMCRRLGNPVVEMEMECPHNHLKASAMMTSGPICEDCGEEV